MCPYKTKQAPVLGPQPKGLQGNQKISGSTTTPHGAKQVEMDSVAYPLLTQKRKELDPMV